MGLVFAKASREVECGNYIVMDRSQSAPTPIPVTIKGQKNFISSHPASNFRRQHTFRRLLEKGA